ncbi:MAG: cbb3-type cytochrome oxidase assembly protein CcoS [Deltaproteobacteria bacterium]|nr:cbb3-type cytochrome oxidase assembly protein CcoS [Deltaproteobacteria bacterium]MBW2669201.1 cbb3-type cytochrome oxidase assembly protein CcoS [Deltaproteobacteria bacterium]MBW2710282.1 cbb3-type cytochrome oxidase assembly protein CcoS [Deltaproteobacteria bacterium]
MYFPYFITYMALGFAISLAVFFWALKNGQFKDQKRARFLPLEDEHEPSSAEISTFHRYETYVLVLLALAGLAASGAVLIFALLNASGA